MTSTGPGSGAFWTGFVSCYGATLQPNDTCSVQVWFGPNDTVPFAAQVRAWTNGTSFAADLTGSGGQALVTGSPNPVEFGTATAGQQGGTQTVTLTNNGQLPGGFFVAVVSGGDVASFRLLHENCTGVPLDPSASCTAQVRFQPDGAGPKEAQLSFFGDQDGGAQVTLLGTGVDPRASLTPDNHDFGRLQVGDTSRAQAFDLTNDGHTPLKMSGASIVGDDADQFRLAGDECTDVTLPAGASCQVHVRFAPDARGVAVGPPAAARRWRLTDGFAHRGRHPEGQGARQLPLARHPAREPRCPRGRRRILQQRFALQAACPGDPSRTGRKGSRGPACVGQAASDPAPARRGSGPFAAASPAWRRPRDC